MVLCSNKNPLFSFLIHLSFSAESTSTTGTSHDIASAVLAAIASDKDVETYISELLINEGNN